MSEYYYSYDGPSQLIIKKNKIYYALLYSEFTLSEASQKYTFYPLTISILLKRQDWFKAPISPHYRHHLKLVLESLFNE